MNPAAPTMPLVRAIDVHKSFGHNVVLHDVSLDVQHGEVVVLIGPSGAGKSTFLRTLNQLETIDGGAIYINGELVGYEEIDGKLLHRTRKDITRQRGQLGMVFQQFNLFPHMTALQNIIHAPIQVKGLKSKAAQQRGRDLLDLVGLSEKASSYPGELSGGQQQRVAIARALAMEPSLLLFDEPTSALDPELVDDVLQVMRTLSQQGQTMIIVTHEMAFARDVADRIVFMANGTIEQSGTPAEVFGPNASERLTTFLGRVSGAAA